MLLPPAEWACYPAGVVQLPPAAAAKMVRHGLKRGWPDFLILHPSGHYGLELKTRTGRLSKGYAARTAKGGVRWREGQEEVFPRLERAGMAIAVCRTLPEVIAALQAWKLPLRGMG